ncbi:MAG: phenylalanine--tRNA ligase subunit beta, partial [Gammaproteobacteria bacterium]|nr:phenylalanine--tRNA ligase subunit beta [Gammaproteobacteria bacterium]NNJ84603.1 phenylalanine--tRNA ligase subunit beta [Gammaproteobacteria bacterium]
PGPIIEAVSLDDIPKPTSVRLRESRLQRLLGVSFAADTVSDVLMRLGMAAVSDGIGADSGTGNGAADNTWRVTPPSFRFDIALEADLIEEVVRVTGYDGIPARRPILPLAPHKVSDATVSLARMRQVLVERGYREAITYSFVDPDIVSLIDPDAPSLALQNPISSEMVVMRTTLLPGLLQAVVHNLRRQQSRVRLFESGLVFNSQHDGEPVQERVLGAVATGSVFAEQWGIPDREVDFFDMKSDVEGLLSLTGQAEQCRFVRPSDSTFHSGALHPGQSALIEQNGHPMGWIGNLHPRIGRELKLTGNILVFQLKLAALESGILPEYIPLSKFPAVRRDIAVVVDTDVSSHAARDCIRQAATGVLKNITVFDEYRGEGIDSGKKSLAFGLVFQDVSRTLQDSEIDGLVAATMAVLKERLGATPRG